jgi:hypothetical protein
MTDEERDQSVGDQICEFLNEEYGDLPDLHEVVSDRAPLPEGAQD